MRIIITTFLLLISISCFSQSNHSHDGILKKTLPVIPYTNFNEDSLLGFNENKLQEEIIEEKLVDYNIKRYTFLRKRKFIDEKYSIGKYKLPVFNNNARLGGGTGVGVASINCASENFDFENGTTSGWNITGNAGIVSTGVDPYGGFPKVFPGGANSLRISSDVAPSGDWGQAVKFITVPAAGTTLFTFHFAMSIFNYPHTAAQAAKFKVVFRDASNNIIACPNYNCFHSTDLGDVGVTTFTPTPNSASFYNPAAVGDSPGMYGAVSSAWNDVTVDLTAYAGQVISATFRIDWCFYGPDWAYCFIDADCPINNLDPIPVCGGNGQVICGPTSMSSYTWTRPGGAISTTSCITTTSSGTHTLQCVPNAIQCTAVPTLTFHYNVNVNPVANFNYTLTPCSSSFLIPFIDNTNLNGGGAITSYTWNYGDSSPFGSTSNPAHLFGSSGTKTVALTVSNGTCTDSIVKTFKITLAPVASFSANSVCQSTSTAFTNLSTTPTGSITSWSWDFTNNGSIDNVTQNPTFIFPTSDTFTTSLIVSNSDLCSNTSTLVINVWGHTIPDFSPDNVCFGSATTFTNSTNIITNLNVGLAPIYNWHFADGSTTVIAINPIHTYTLGGNLNAVYIVTLTSTSSHGCIDSVAKIVNVYATPTASFTSDSVCFGSQSHLINASNGNGNTLNGYLWDFSSNGTTDIIGVPSPNYTFPLVGSNLVTYTVQSNPTIGLTCRNINSTLTVWVNPLPQPAFTFTNACINTQPLSFDGTGSTIAIGSNTTFDWTFGDGAVASGSVNTHPYALPSTYNVTLTVTSNKGCQAMIAQQIEVYKKPWMQIAVNSGCLGGATSFTAVSLSNSGSVTSWLWDVNNSISSIETTGQQNSYTYPAAGSQTLQLVSITNHNCRDTTTRLTYVNYNPTPQFSVDKPSGCPLPHCVKFTDNSSPVPLPAHIANWTWDFGDGKTVSSTTNAQQNNCYTNSSSSQLALFTVSLTTTTDSGCVASNIKPNFITVYPKPIANYTIVPEFGDVLVPLVHFINQSVDYTKWWWSFGDGPKIDSINANPDHYYPGNDASSYHSILIVANQYGCRDTANVLVEIAPEYSFYIPNAFTPNGDNTNDIFTGMGVGIATYEMWVFDRWGASIFYTDDITKGWNGKVQGKSEDAKEDVYTWKVKLKDVLNKNHSYVGHVTLLK
jgi:gliding motility-associated-like protein